MSKVEFEFIKPVELQGFFNMLLDKSISVKKGKSVYGTAGTILCAASYLAGESSIRAIVFFDLPLACYASASLSMVPPAVATDSIKSRALSDSLIGNLHEVFNVMSSFLSHRLGRVHLGKVAASTKSSITELIALAQEHSQVDAEVSIAGYGTGQMSIVVL